ncbi:MAG: patatin-like phospholipase family protein [Actinomycetota bacterium]
MSRVGLVLGAGGFGGRAFHAGVLSALEEGTGWDPRDAEIVVGTSAGAQVGTGLRIGLSAADMAAKIADRPASPEGERIFALLGETPTLAPKLRQLARRPHLPSPQLLRRFAMHPLTSMGSFATAFLPEGSLSVQEYARAFHRVLGDEWPEEALWLCAARANDGRREVFGRTGSPPTDVATAVAASCAVPWLFAPVEIDGVRYVDGGVCSPTNLDLLAGKGLDLVIVVSPMSVARHPGRQIDIPLRRLFRLRLAREAAKVRRGGTRVVAFQPAAEEMAALGLNAMDPNPHRWRVAIGRIREATFQRLRRADFIEQLESIAA